MNRKLKARIIEIFGTQADFASKIRGHESAVSRVVRGRRVLNIEEKTKWAKALRTSPEEIFGSGEDVS